MIIILVEIFSVEFNDLIPNMQIYITVFKILLQLTIDKSSHNVRRTAFCIQDRWSGRQLWYAAIRMAVLISVYFIFSIYHVRNERFRHPKKFLALRFWSRMNSSIFGHLVSSFVPHCSFCSKNCNVFFFCKCCRWSLFKVLRQFSISFMKIEFLFSIFGHFAFT